MYAVQCIYGYPGEVLFSVRGVSAPHLASRIACFPVEAATASH